MVMRFRGVRVLKRLCLFCGTHFKYKSMCYFLRNQVCFFAYSVFLQDLNPAQTATEGEIFMTLPDAEVIRDEKGKADKIIQKLRAKVLSKILR